MPARDPAFLLGARPGSPAALRTLKALGFADPPAALANLHLLSPTPREAELLGSVLPRLLQALREAPDPDRALNNLERYAAACDRSVLFRTLAAHPGAVSLLVAVGGSSQFLADTLRRRPSTLAWLLEGPTMRQWLADELGGALAADLAPFAAEESRLNVLRRFRDRHLVRIGARDLLGDADLTGTVEELSRLADVCLEAAGRLGRERLEALHGSPGTGFAVIAMGKLGGDELNYSSDIDVLFVYGEDGETAGGPAGPLAHGEYARRLGRAIVAALEAVTEEGRAYRVDLRLRPEGRVGPVALSLAGWSRYLAERAEPWERQALIKARPAAGDPALGRAFLDLVQPFVYRPGIDPGLVREIRRMKRAIDRGLRARPAEGHNVKLGPGGIREIEFLVQALQLLYGGEDPWLRERSTLRAIFRLTERGYLAPDLGRALSEGYRHLRLVEHRLQILDELQTHSLPADARALGQLARRIGIAAPPERAAREFRRRHSRVRRQVRRAFLDFFAARTRPAAPRPRIPSAVALSATGFADPDRARLNFRLLFEGRPLTPYPALTQAALGRLFPALLDALWQSPDPDEALNQFERFVARAGSRAGSIELLAREPAMVATLVRLCARGEFLAELVRGQPELLAALARPEPRKGQAAFEGALAPSLAPGLGLAGAGEQLRHQKQAEELGVVWRHLSGLTTLEQYAREMTALAEAALAVAWQVAQAAAAERHPAPPVPAVIVGLGKLGGRELTAGSDLDLFVVYGAEDDLAHAFYGASVERLSALLGDITAAGVVFPVDLRLRPGGTGSGLASSVAALERYHRDWGDLWERQMLTRARLVGGTAGPAGWALGRRVRGILAQIVYGAALGRAELKAISEVRQRMEVELGRESPGRLHVKYGRGGLVDVEFIVQALQLVHGASHPAVRRPNTLAALAALGRAGLLPGDEASALAEHYRLLRRVSLALRLFGVRPADTLELAGPMPARIAKGLDYPDREAFLRDYERRTGAVRASWERLCRG